MTHLGSPPQRSHGSLRRMGFAPGPPDPEDCWPDETPSGLAMTRPSDFVFSTSPK